MFVQVLTFAWPIELGRPSACLSWKVPAVSDDVSVLGVEL